MKFKCPHCGEEINISISSSYRHNSNSGMMMESRPIETGLAVTIMPKKGESVFACIPPFKYAALFVPRDVFPVLDKPDQFFTASTIWRPVEAEEYLKVFPRLIKKNKIMKVGSINNQFQVELSTDGNAFLEKMKKKYPIA